jgi:hypothetical protein
LNKNRDGRYSLPINLNEPVFYISNLNDIISTVFSYGNGTIESSDNTVGSCGFSVQQIEREHSMNCNISGTMYFTYSEESGISLPDKEDLKIYLNSTNDKLFIDCENFKETAVKLYDMNGKEVLNHSINRNDEINISHLEKGIYIVSVFSESKVIGNIKIVKQ